MRGTLANAIVKSMATWERKEADFYPTPPDVTHALLRYLDLPEGTRVWEPACGDGAMSEVLKEFKFEVISTDLRDDSGYGEGGVDFLNSVRDDNPTQVTDWVITNPPFNLSVEFIKKALSITPNVAMLLKSQYFQAANRLAFFEECPPTRILPLTWRPAFLESERGSSPIMEVAWFVWTPESGGGTIYEPLPRPWKPERRTRKKKNLASGTATEYLRSLGFNV